MKYTQYAYGKKLKTEPITKRILTYMAKKIRIGKHGFSKSSALLFAVIFAGIGAYVVVRSFAATGDTANLWMDADGGSCTYSSTAITYNSSTACDSFSEACSNIVAGKTMLIKGGTYTGSETSFSNCSPASKVTFKVASEEAATTTSISGSNASNLQIEGLYVNMANNGNGPGSFMQCSSDITFKNVEMEGDHATGNAYGDAFQIWPRDSSPICHNQDITLDGVYVHDLHTYVAAQDNHTDCVQAASAHGLTIKNSRFVKCGTQSFQLNDDAWPCNVSGCASLTDVVIENSWIGMNGTVGGLTNLTVRNNTFTDTPNFANGYNKGTVIITGNIFHLYSDFHCTTYATKGVATTKTFSYNLTDVNCPANTNSIKVSSINSLLVNASINDPDTWDLHLSGNNAAVGAVPYNLAPTTDYDGDARPQTGNVDIGADEYGGIQAPPDTTDPTASLTAPTNGATVSGASVTMSATASDDTSVSRVEFYVDGDLVDTDTSSPYSITWDSRTVSNGSHTIQARAYDPSNNIGNSATRNVTTNNTAVCNSSSNSWQNHSLSAQSSNFTFDFDATPSVSNSDTVVGLSDGAASGYSDLATAVRFNSTGAIDARNGGSYTAASTYNYTAGTSYHFTVTVNMTNNTYTVEVTPAGGSETTLASNYAFRTEQASVSQLNNWASFTGTGTLSVCGATVGTAGPSAPANNTIPSISGTTAVGSTLTTTSGSWSGSPTPTYTYKWQRCNTSGASCADISSATSTTYLLVSGDSGSTLRSVVTGTNSGGNASATSNATATITTPPSTPTNTTLPSISGTVRVGSTLTTSNGSWNGSPTSYTYQWQRCDSSGANCANITNATSTNNNFTLSCYDYGTTGARKTLKVVVRATNTTGGTNATTNATSTVSKPTNPKKGDFNDDCFVNAADVGLFTFRWRNNGATYPVYDMTGPTGTPDGEIDSWDLNILVTSYGYGG